MTATGRKKEPQISRQSIIDAAIDIGAASGWPEVSFQAIADRTGLSKGGIIHHFRTKQELLDELMSQSLSELSHWMEDYTLKTGNANGAMGYLQFVVDKTDDIIYQKSMKIIIQAIQKDVKYIDQWQAWQQKYIFPGDVEPDVISTMAMVIAEGLWYAEHLSAPTLSKVQKQQILQYLKSKQ